jgi:hypothetical protein
VNGRDEKGRFVLGHPIHRQRGSRNLLGEAFLTDIYHDWLEHGMQAVRQVREDDPSSYLKVVALVVSKCDDSVFNAVARDHELVQLIEERRQAALLQIEKMREEPRPAWPNERND